MATTGMTSAYPTPCSSLPFNRINYLSPIPAKTKPKPKTNQNKPNKLENFQNPKPLNFPKTQKFPSRNEPDTSYPWSVPLHKKNPHAICKDIKRFARQDKLKEALTILDYLYKLGIPVNATTFSHLIGACIRSKSRVFAEQIHAHIRTNGLENNEFVKRKVVEMYASCGLLEKAETLLFGDNEIESFVDVYAWNALLRGNVVSGRRKNRDLLYVFGKMRENGVELNEYSYSCMIKSFGGSVAFREGLKMHALLIKNGCVANSIVKTSLIDMYFKCRRVKLACLLFDEIPERDIVLWGAMIAGFAHNGLQKEAIKYMRWMVKEGIVPNSVVLTTILPIVGEVGAWKLGKEIHAYLLKKGNYSEQPFVKSALIDMYCKCGDMNYGRKVFYNSKNRNTVAWTALMSGYISNGRLEQALRSIRWMQQEGFRPDIVSIATVLPVCSKLRALKQGREIHGYLVKNWLLPNVSVTTSLIVMYSKCGFLEQSRRLFKTMEFRNVIAWTAFIDSCVKNGSPFEALEVFRSMQLSKHRADAVAISRVSGICCDLGLLKLGKEVHGQILKKDIERIPYVTAGLVRMYGKCGVIEKAKRVFDLYPSKGSVGITAMIEAYGYSNHFREALDLFYQMVENGLSPNLTIFDTVLAICDRAGLGDEACKIFKLVTQRFRIRPLREHCSIMSGLLARLGRTQEAERYAEWTERLVSKRR